MSSQWQCLQEKDHLITLILLCNAMDWQTPACHIFSFPRAAWECITGTHER
jgi:hypothetical protein